jgi:hypothetical protein
VAVRDNAFGELLVANLMPMIEPDGRASIRVAQRIGSRFEASAT